MRHIKKFFEKAITKEDDIKDILIYLTDVGLEIKKQEIKWFDKRMKDFDSQYSFYYNFKSKFSGGQKSFLFSLSGSVSDEEDQISKTKEVMEALEQVKPRLEDYGKVYIKYHPLKMDLKKQDIPFLVYFNGSPLKSVNAITRILNKIFNRISGFKIIKELSWNGIINDNAYYVGFWQSGEYADSGFAEKYQ